MQLSNHRCINHTHYSIITYKRYFMQACTSVEPANVSVKWQQQKKTYKKRYIVLHDYSVYISRGVGRNFRRGFPPIVDPRCRGLGAQPPEADGYFKTLWYKFAVFCNVWASWDCTSDCARIVGGGFSGFIFWLALPLNTTKSNRVRLKLLNCAWLNKCLCGYWAY